MTEAAEAFKAGDTFEITGLLYIQGESDSPEEAILAGKRLTELAENLRKDLPFAGKMIVVCGGISAEGETRDIVKLWQADVAASTNSIVYFDNSDLRDHLYDKLHFNKAAKFILGERFAQAFLDMPRRRKFSHGGTFSQLVMAVSFEVAG